MKALAALLLAPALTQSAKQAELPPEVAAHTPKLTDMLAKMESLAKTKQLGHWPTPSSIDARGGWDFGQDSHERLLNSVWRNRDVRWFHNPGETRWDAVVWFRRGGGQNFLVWVRDAFGDQPMLSATNTRPDPNPLDLRRRRLDSAAKPPRFVDAQPPSESFIYPMELSELVSYSTDSGFAWVYDPDHGVGYWRAIGLISGQEAIPKDASLVGQGQFFRWWRTRDELRVEAIDPAGILAE